MIIFSLFHLLFHDDTISRATLRKVHVVGIKIEMSYGRVWRQVDFMVQEAFTMKFYNKSGISVIAGEADDDVDLREGGL